MSKQRKKNNSLPRPVFLLKKGTAGSLKERWYQAMKESTNQIDFTLMFNRRNDIEHACALSFDAS